MKTTTLVLTVIGCFACAQAGGYAAAPSPAPQQHAAVKTEEAKKPSSSGEAKGPAPDDGKWHFAGEPVEQKEIRRVVVPAPPSRPAMAHPVHPAPLAKPAPLKPAAATHAPFIQTDTLKTVNSSLPVRPPAVVAHRGPSFNDVPHRGPNPAVIVGVAANTKSANTGAINGTAFHSRF